MERPYAELNAAERRQRLRELATVFLRLGSTAFGGPAAHIAMMDHELVGRRRWLDRQRFLDMMGAANLIPGPNSTEVAIHIGLERAGWRGLVVAGATFILPATLLVWGIAALYTRFQMVPQVGWLLYGVKPVIIAVVAQALWGLGKSALKDVPTAVVGAGVLLLSRLGIQELVLLLLAGVLVMLLRQPRLPATVASVGWVAVPGLHALGGAAPAFPAITVGSVFWFFLKVGSVLYGSGYVLLAFLQRDLVERWHWLAPRQLLDAVAVGQFTPGPVFTTATFIGYLLAGNKGALVATIGIFLPAFVLVAAVNPWVPRLRRSPWAAGFLDGVNVASLGLMAAVTWELGQAALMDWVTVGLAVLSLALLLRLKWNSAWLVAAGGLVGLLSHLLT